MENRPPQTLDMALGLAIRVRRHAAAMSQSDLGSAVGVSFQQMQKYERGSNRVSFSMLVKIARALGCRAADLVLEVERINGLERVGSSRSALSVPEAAPILDALAEIRSPEVRGAVLELAQRLAGAK